MTSHISVLVLAVFFYLLFFFFCRWKKSPTVDIICRAKQSAMLGGRAASTLTVTPQPSVSQTKSPYRQPGEQAAAAAAQPHVGAIRWCHHGTISHQRTCERPVTSRAQPVPTRWHSDGQTAQTCPADERDEMMAALFMRHVRVTNGFRIPYFCEE